MEPMSTKDRKYMGKGDSRHDRGTLGRQALRVLYQITFVAFLMCNRESDHLLSGRCDFERRLEKAGVVTRGRAAPSTPPGKAWH